MYRFRAQLERLHCMTTQPCMTRFLQVYSQREMLHTLVFCLVITLLRMICKGQRWSEAMSDSNGKGFGSTADLDWTSAEWR